MNGDEPMLAAANDLRATISDLLEVQHSDRIILAPGILVALRVLFSHLHIERIALTSEEYYGAEHFPGATVRAASCDALFDPRLTGDSEAVLASPASWRGARQPVAELFDSIRKRLGEGAPLLVADYAHAGSVGFPSVDRLGADVICGDLEKWILPPTGIPEWHSSGSGRSRYFYKPSRRFARSFSPRTPPTFRCWRAGSSQPTSWPYREDWRPSV
jgi:hypothetical protein